MMTKLNEAETKKNAARYGLMPVKIRDSDVVQLSKKSGGKFEPIQWQEFFELLKKKRLAVYISKTGYMKIMSDDVYE